jgi:hypothetical protein
MFLTPHRICLSIATPACFPTRPPFVRLRTEKSLSAVRYSIARPHSKLVSTQSRWPSRVVSLSFHLRSRTSKLSQVIQTP